MSNCELSVICLHLKILVVYRLFRDEKPPIPHLRPVSPHYVPNHRISANLSQGVSVLVTQTPFSLLV